jgi:hypothetical protein
LEENSKNEHQKALEELAELKAKYEKVQTSL